MVNNDRHVADDHKRSRSVKTYSLILSQDVIRSNQITIKVQNSFQNFVLRSYKSI